MTHKKICLASDNWAPVHPAIMQGITEANTGYSPSYGSDHWTEEAQKLIQSALKVDGKVIFLPTGTGANVLGLMLTCQRHEAIICTDISHINYQESGAAEAIIGCKLLTIPHKDGKATTEAILKKLKYERAFGKHSTSPRTLSISQPTEVGTVYSLDELNALSALCKAENLLFHMDGSRLYNAAVSLGVSLETIVNAAQVDILSLGGTKNGLMGAEALVIVNSELEKGSDHLQKQTLQLLSKMRYLSAQYIPFFKDELWKTLATHANQKAREIASVINSTPHLTLSYPVASNQIFFTAPPSWIPLIQDRIWCHLWDREKNEIRLIASWNTTDEDVMELGTILKRLAGEKYE